MFITGYHSRERFEVFCRTDAVEGDERVAAGAVAGAINPARKHDDVEGSGRTAVLLADVACLPTRLADERRRWSMVKGSARTQASAPIGGSSLADGIEERRGDALAPTVGRHEEELEPRPLRSAVVHHQSGGRHRAVVATRKEGENPSMPRGEQDLRLQLGHRDRPLTRNHFLPEPGEEVGELRPLGSVRVSEPAQIDHRKSLPAPAAPSTAFPVGQESKPCRAG